MHCIAIEITKIQNAKTVNRTAAAMIDLLVFVCTYCNSLDHSTIFKSWSNLIVATFDYACLINHRKTNCGCYTSTCNRYPIETTHTLSQQQIAYMIWFKHLHETISPLKEQLNHLFPHKRENLLEERLKDMLKKDRYYLIALISEKEYEIKKRVLLTQSTDNGPKIDKRAAGVRQKACDLTASMLYGPERAVQDTNNKDFKAVESDFNKYLHESATATMPALAEQDSQKRLP